MDLVTTNLVSSFREQQSLAESLDSSVLFEHFANFCITSAVYSDEFDIEDVHVAGGNDLQLDGVLIIVNGVLVESVEEVDDLSKTNKYVDAEFIFIQAKSGSDFNGAEISNMFYGVRDLFSANPTMPRNEALSLKEEVIRHVYTKSAIFRGNPQLRMYYVTTGKWLDDTKLLARVSHEIQTLEELDIFKSPPSFEAIDARKLQQFFNRAQNALTKTVTFANTVTLPAINGVKEAYLGYIPALEYLAMITDENHNLLRGLFYENVRDFQGENPVNKEIEETLRSETRAC